MEGRVAALVLAADLCPLTHQQTHHLQVTCRGRSRAQPARLQTQEVGWVQMLGCWRIFIFSFPSPTHESCPVQSPTVLLIKGVDVGSFSQEEVHHLEERQ